MKVDRSQVHKGIVRVTPEHADDLWHLTHLVDPGDHVRSKTTRKIRKTPDADPVRKTVTLTIAVEKHEFDSNLRLSGTVVEGPEDVPKGSYHTISVEARQQLTIIKPKWYGYQLKRIDEAAKAQQAPIIICLLDREDVLFAKTQARGFAVLSFFSGDVAKKRFGESGSNTFYTEVVKQLGDYTTRYDPQSIILASPSFWREELMKKISDPQLRNKIVQATCSSITASAVSEVLRRPEVKEALKLERVSQELHFVEQLLVAISKNTPSAYGLANVTAADQAGAVSILLLTDKLISEARSDGTFEPINALMQQVEQKQGDIHIISSEHDGGKRLDGIGGIGALLRFNVS